MGFFFWIVAVNKLLPTKVYEFKNFVSLNTIFRRSGKGCA